jgi:N6-L-threonylcarbamoyladenine synthase
VVDKLAKLGNPKAYDLPIGRTDKAWDFSYSGLKTAVLRLIQRLVSEYHVDQATDLPLTVMHDICASFQYRATGILCKKAMAALHETGLTTLAIAGGVAANAALREQCQQAIDALNTPQPNRYRLFIPAMIYCTDNAAMVGASAFFNPLTEDLGHEVFSRS